MSANQIEWIDGPNGALALRRHPGRGPTVAFIHGFRSDMGGTKGERLDDAAAAAGAAFVRFDLSGHGRSAGAFEDGTIGAWRADAAAVVDAIEGPVLLVGSSMGGWIALLAALDRPERVAGLALIAPAPDFTERLIWAELDAAARADLEATGRWMRPSVYGDGPYPITARLIEEGRNHLLLDGPIAVRGPVRIIHGQMDEAVPWGLSLELAERLDTEDVEVRFLKNGDHRLSSPAHLDTLMAMVMDLHGDLSCRNAF